MAAGFLVKQILTSITFEVFMQHSPWIIFQFYFFLIWQYLTENPRKCNNWHKENETTTCIPYDAYDEQVSLALED